MKVTHGPTPAQLLSVKWGVATAVGALLSPRLESGIVMEGAISEAARSDLYTGLSQAIGPERAEILMSALPLHDLDEVATKKDIAVLGAELRPEIADLRTELKTDISDLRTDMHTEIGALRKSMTNWMLTLLVAIIGAMAGMAFIT